MINSSEGILFIATGDLHRREALESASITSLVWRTTNFLITDSLLEARAAGVFDKVLLHPQPVQGYRDKIVALQDLPFQQTLFLDSDARLTASVELYSRPKATPIWRQFKPLFAYQKVGEIQMFPICFQKLTLGYCFGVVPASNGHWCVNGCFSTTSCKALQGRPGTRLRFVQFSGSLFRIAVFGF